MSAATVSKRKGYIGAGVAGLLLAAGYLAMSLDLPFGRIDQPGAGVFPIVAGCVLIAASLSAIWEGVRLDPLVTVDIPTGADLKRLLSLVALLIAFVIAIPLLGPRSWRRPAGWSKAAADRAPFCSTAIGKRSIRKPASTPNIRCPN